LNSLTDIIKGSRTEELPERIAELLTKIKEIEKELAKVRTAQVMGQIATIAENARVIAGTTVIATALGDGIGAEDLRKIATDLKSRAQQSVVALVSVSEGKAVLVVAVSEAAQKIKAGELVKIGSTVLGGGGGGKSDFAQGGGTKLTEVAAALTAISDAIGR
jgi:alanyl-tRNA synthetase